MGLFGKTPPQARPPVPAPKKPERTPESGPRADLAARPLSPAAPPKAALPAQGAAALPQPTDLPRAEKHAPPPRASTGSAESPLDPAAPSAAPQANRRPGPDGRRAKARRPRRIILALAGLLLALALSGLLYRQFVLAPQKAFREREFSSLLETLLPLLRAEENAAPPPAPALLALSPRDDPRARLLKEGASFFVARAYPRAREAFLALGEARPEDRRLLPLIGATHLREANFSLAKDYFRAAQSPPLKDPRVWTGVDLGLALAHFNLMDLDSALPLADGAYRERLRIFGRAHPETLSAANILAGILIGLGRFPEAESLLEEGLQEALRAGGGPEDPLLADGFNLLALSYDLRDSDKDLADLFPAPETPDADGLSGAEAAPIPAPEIADGARPLEALSYPPLDYAAALSLYQALTAAFPASRARPDLLKALIQERAPDARDCEAPADGAADESLLFLCASLADALSKRGAFAEATVITLNLLEWESLPRYAHRHVVYRNAAFLRHLEGDLVLAEDNLRSAIKALEDKDELADGDISFIILRSLTLAQNLLGQGRGNLEAEIELMAAITFLEKAIGRRALDARQESPLLFWKLARVLREEGRRRDSQKYFDRALASVGAIVKAFPELEEELGQLRDLIRADKNHRDVQGEPPPFPQTPQIFFEAEKQVALGPSPIAPPAAMRLELEAAIITARLPEFARELKRAIAETESQEGAGSVNHLRYLSLELKRLEELGDYERLLDGLETMITLAPQKDPRARAFFVSSARAYEGRTRLKSGDREGAKMAFEAAYDLLSDVAGAEERRLEIFRELSALN
ncbi:MAG: tetratricopeptide repeat protein [Deltaproteobacteria bacterium]|nr:tetratricopeptide repeat protein [Deltaproteobacteria bacterium]